MEKAEIIAFGTWVKDQRKARKLTQTDVAKAIDVAPGSISALEQGSIRAVGHKLEKQLRCYFGEANSVDSIESPSAEAIPHSTILRIAEVVASQEFNSRVEKIRDALGCSRQEAIATILQHELQKLVI